MWYAKNTGGYNIGSDEANENCKEIYNYLNAQGYVLEAVCAVIGNINRECGFNPWQWENWYGYNSRITTTNYNRQSGGYGLMQFTPYPPTPYPNIQPYVDSPVAQSLIYYAPNFYDRPGSPTDGNGQLEFMHYQMFTQSPSEWFAQSPNSGQYNAYLNALSGIGVDYTRFYNMTAAQFKIATGPDPNQVYYRDDWIGAFATCYLRPTSTYLARDWSVMTDAFDYYYLYLAGYTPQPPEPPVPPGPVPPQQRRGMPVWMMIDYRY